MLEREILLSRKLNFIDMNILEQLILYDYSLAFPVLIKKLKHINIRDRNVVRRRIKKLKDLKLVHFDEGTNPLMLEAYQHREKEIENVKTLLKGRMILVT